MAARLLGAREVVGFDADPDAVRSANENLLINPSIDRVRFELAELRSATFSTAGVVTANLTGALLVRSAPQLVGLVSPGGHLVVSGLLREERSLVEAALVDNSHKSDVPPGVQPHVARVVWAQEEDGWVGLVFNLEPGGAV